MSFSLLYQNEKKVESVLEDTLFDDLKIRKVLEHLFDNYSEADEVLDILKEVPDKDSLRYRQEIFTDIMNDDNQVFESLYYQLVDLAGRFTSLREATENIKRKVFFIFYEYYYFLFLETVKDKLTALKVTSNCFNDLISSISKILDNSEVIKKRDVINRIYSNITSHFKINLEYHEGAPYYQIDFEEKNNLEDKLIAISKALGINFIKQARQVGRKEINPYFLYQISLNDKKIYDELTSFYEENKGIFVNDVTGYVKEAKYYLSLKTIFTRINKKGIPYCKVDIMETNDNYIHDAYDVSLTLSNIEVVPNDYVANDLEFIQFVLGVNSGGKTCYLRSVASNYVMFMTCGYIFAKSAKLYPVKYIHTHFPNEENYSFGEGRLRDEIKRLETFKKNFSPECIAFLNETFSSTSEEKACVLTNELLDSIGDTKAKVMYVTHQYKIFEQIHEDRISFYTPVVVEGESNKRTHKIMKVDKQLLSYVGDILFKHGLTRNQLLERRKIKHE